MSDFTVPVSNSHLDRLVNEVNVQRQIIRNQTRTIEKLGKELESIQKNFAQHLNFYAKEFERFENQTSIKDEQIGWLTAYNHRQAEIIDRLLNDIENATI